MPGSGRGGRFVFVGKEPMVLRLIVALLIANFCLGMLIAFGARHFLPKSSPSLPPCGALTELGVQYYAPGIVCWYARWWFPIHFILLAFIVAIFIAFRKRVRYVRRRG